MADEPSVLTWQDGRVGRIRLNRPNALNALDLGMIRLIRGALETWRHQPRVHAVVVDGAGDRAYCSGGDIRAMRAHSLAGEYDRVETFFREEYALNLFIAEYPKPYVALIDGVCMGGGIGVAVHGRIRVATEAALLAMPETAIGFFPDIGASWFLPRLPGALGMFLSLTGTRLRGADAVHAGLATHYVPRAALPELAAAIARDGVATVAEHAASLPPFSLAPHRDAIDRCFGADSVAGIVRGLEAEDSDWARETLATLRQMSPASVLWSFALLRRGADSSLAEALQAELALTRRVVRHPDYLEGVRAMVVDKDRKPRWKAARIEDVDPAEIAAVFA
ncbi:MAG: enoyl-CoA hydratase/isomerase family protein [Alphaproteobacteria bacterium]|nr:enoyl-CoA hydratase/isomerase family protein [Alphaproteobacteria bacterium]